MNKEQERFEFLRRRKTGIGGSDVAALFGLSKWKTAADVWRDKVSEEIKDEPNDLLDLCSHLEDYTARKYAELTGHKVQKRNTLIVHPMYEFIHGNIDREILLDDRGVGILECKALGFSSFRRVEMYGLPDDYLFQAQHYLLCDDGRRYKFFAFAILNRDTGKMLTFEVQPDTALQVRIMYACVDFWKYVQTKTEPPAGWTATGIQHKENAAERVPQYTGTITDRKSDMILNDLIRQRTEAAEVAKEAGDVVTAIDEQIASNLGDIEAAECIGARIFYKSTIRNTFDSKRFQKENPDLYGKYIQQTATKRSLRIYAVNNQ